MKKINKKKKQIPPSFQIESFTTEFGELKEQIQILQQEQSKIQKDLMQSLESQIKMQSSINKILIERMKIAQTGISSTRKIVNVIQKLVKQMKPDHQINYQLLFQQLFPEEYLESQNRECKQNITENFDMVQGQFVYSPLPFGQLLSFQTPLSDSYTYSANELNNNHDSQI